MLLPDREGGNAMDDLMPLRRLRLLLVEDQEEGGVLKTQLETAAQAVAGGTQPLMVEVQWVRNIKHARDYYSQLRQEGKQLHFVAMDYRLAAPDDPLAFLDWYLKQNPCGYWCWCTAHADKVYPPTVSPAYIHLHRRMLTAYAKPSGTFEQPLKELVQRTQADLRGRTPFETKKLILTDRETLAVIDGWVVRKEGDYVCAFDDELVPGFHEFDVSVLIHVPDLRDAENFAEGIIRRSGSKRVRQDEQSKLRKAWVGRKGYKAWSWHTAKNFSIEFGGKGDWAKFASQFNVNLLWLTVAAKRGWSGSLLEEHGKALNSKLPAVQQHGAHALWSQLGDKNFPSHFRPWAHVYQRLNASAFWMEVSDDSTGPSAGDDGSPRRAWEEEVRMTIDPGASLYIDRGEKLYEIRTGRAVSLNSGHPGN
jgi:hypothetical protein